MRFTLRPVEARLLPSVAKGEESSTSVGRNPASVLPAPVGAISSAERLSRAFAKQRQLVLARRPAPRGEPFFETLRQQRSRVRVRWGCVGKRSGEDTA